MERSTTKSFQYWQTRTLIATMIGYAMFYFVRKNLSLAMPGMQADLGITKAELGIFLTLHGLVYGVSKFINGFIGDRVNSRYFMITGLVLSAVCNIIFGFSSAVLIFGLVWIFNGWFQGMGFPPCARLITHWVPPKELATKMSVWNTSHSIGAGLVIILCGYIVQLGWRWCFYIPSAIAILGAVFIWVTLRDTPSSVGLPEIKTSGKPEKEMNTVEYKKFVKKKVFLNPVVWTVGIACFFIYTVRYAVLDWGPTLLSEWKGISIQSSGWMVAGFEISGIAGMLLAGWVTDRFFGGRAVRVCAICMALASIFVLLFWLLPSSPMLMTGLLMAAGFCIYGPQALTGVITANTVTKRAAATAIGFTSLFSYASTIISGWGLGMLAQSFGWSYATGALCIVGLVGMFVFILIWNVKVDGYEE
jgi:OPA family glycerol-3-phosphate transporter-like MFS transporter/OPA family sugar phosphate sensor protein UhpC-like MFS transporter